MTTHYSILFSIRCDHGFYGSGLAKDLNIVPTSECRDLLRRHRLMFKSIGAGRATAIDERRDFGPPAAPDIRPVVGVPDGTVFRFALELSDARFFTITDVNQQALRSGRAYVFSSSGIAVQNVGGETIVPVHTGALPVPVVLLPKRFVGTVDAALEPMHVEVRNRAGGVVMRRVLPPRDGQPAVNDEPISVFVDSTGLDDGLYTVCFLDNNEVVISEMKAFITDDSERGVIGFAELHYEAAIMNLDPRPVFTIEFPVRAIRWIYDVSVRPVTDPALAATAIDARRLRLAGEPVPFTRNPDPAPSPPAPPPTRVTFTSNAPIPLREDPRTGIKLIQSPTGPAPPADPDVIIDNLPNPHPRRLELAAGQLQSRMHVTVN